MSKTEQPKMTKYTMESGVGAFSVQIDEVSEWFRVTTGLSGGSNNWLLLANAAAQASGEDCVVCVGPRPLLRVIPAKIEDKCVMELMNKTVPNDKCSKWDKVYPLVDWQDTKPIFSNKVADGGFSCIKMSGTGKQLGRLNHTTHCISATDVGRKFQPQSRADIWWWCGDSRIFDKLPLNMKGYCALITLLLPVDIFPTSVDNLLQIVNTWQPNFSHSFQRAKRSTWQDQNVPTYIDAIGVPRGVPDEYKIADQVASGFESLICWWCTINKNVDRINYVHYNVQRLGNWTQSGFEAVHGQLSATSLMAFQNRIALDMLLAERGGVCSMFGEQCCTFIPNNTAPDGSLTNAIEGLRTLKKKKMKEQSGIDTSIWITGWMLLEDIKIWFQLF
ncbi:uncharacterized protein LOC144051935 [Vanacampus margaritifer]